MKPPIFIDIMPIFKPGDPRPEGYLEWHEWARVQHKAGLRQRRCKSCGNWMFPQEVKDHTCKPGPALDRRVRDRD